MKVESVQRKLNLFSSQRHQPPECISAFLLLKRRCWDSPVLQAVLASLFIRLRANRPPFDLPHPSFPPSLLLLDLPVLYPPASGPLSNFQALLISYCRPNWRDYVVYRSGKLLKEDLELKPRREGSSTTELSLRLRSLRTRLTGMPTSTPDPAGSN